MTFIAGKNQLRTHIRSKSFWKVLVFLVLLSSPYTYVKAQKDSIKVVISDTRVIVPRYPQKEHLEEFLNDRNYQYKDDPQPPSSPFEKWFQWFWKKIAALFEGKSYKNFWQYVLLLSMAALFVFLLYKAGILEFVFTKRANSEPTDYIVGQENIHEINFEKAIDDALATGDYRLAIRLQYLRTLKLLSTKELINWRPNRTNYSYVQELEMYPYHADFVQVTRFFEFAWYGDFRIEKAEYEEMEAFSVSFHDKLNQRAHV